MNQAEVIHAIWVHRDCPNLSLLDASQADTQESLLFDSKTTSLVLHQVKVALPMLIGSGEETC